MKSAVQIKQGHSNKNRGIVSELMVSAVLTKKGYQVLKPLDVTLPYDIVTILNNKFEKLQIKTGKYEHGVIKTRVQKRKYIANAQWELQPYSADEIDGFLVFCPELNKLFKVDVQKTSNKMDLYLRVDKTKNNQSKHVLWAKDYEIGSLT